VQPNSPNDKPNPKKYQFPVIEASMNGLAPLQKTHKSEFTPDGTPNSTLHSKRNSQTYYGRKFVQLQQPTDLNYKSPQPLYNTDKKISIKNDLSPPLIDQSTGLQLYHKFLVENQQQENFEQANEEKDWKM